MEETEVINAFELIKTGLAEPQLASLATLTADARPWVRYVMLSADSDLNLFVNTFRNSRKVAQIEKNPEVHLSVGVSGTADAKQYLQIEALASVSDALELKQKLWSDSLSEYFSGPDDPNYVVMVMRPYRIEVYDMKAMDPKVWEAAG